MLRKIITSKRTSDFVYDKVTLWMQIYILKKYRDKHY